MKDTKHIRQDFNSVAWVMPQGSDFRALGVLRGSNLFFFKHGHVASGDKNISILHSPCRTSDLQFSLVLQTHALVLKNCMGGLMFLKFLISLLK